jgi:acyl carrier protein
MGGMCYFCVVSGSANSNIVVEELGKLIMKTGEFLNALEDIMEFDDFKLTTETSLTELEEFDSLAVMGLIAFIDETFEKLIKADKFKTITTIDSLMELIGREHFE